MDFLDMSFADIGLCVAKLALAMALGFAIGLERKMRFKEAGIRTHTIVCFGSCLYMLISQHGFMGTADSARVAAQIVSGIGFIGAGMIFYHKQMIHGLTTAAGIWATAAVGMAAGSRMWLVAIGAALLIIIIQCILHLPFKVFHSQKYIRLHVNFRCVNGDEREKVKQAFGVQRFSKIHAEKDGDELIYRTIISTDATFSDADIYNALKDYPFIESISREDDDL